MQPYKFFDAPIGTYGNALINWSSAPAHQLVAYAHSYRMAAMNLISFRAQRGVGDIDEGALPILFLYRHSLELFLKSIVLKAATITINDDELSAAIPKLWREHSLTALAKMAEPVISESTKWPVTWNNELKRKIYEIACNIDEVDPGSYSFRYPVNTKGRASLPALFLTNIFKFSNEVERTLDDVAQFCRDLESDRIKTSDQMKLALHPLSYQGQ